LGGVKGLAAPGCEAVAASMPWTMPCIMAGNGEAAIICAIWRIRSGSAAIAAICSCQRSMIRRARSSIEGAAAAAAGSPEGLGWGALPSSAIPQSIVAAAAAR